MSRVIRGRLAEAEDDEAARRERGRERRMEEGTKEGGKEGWSE